MKPKINLFHIKQIIQIYLVENIYREILWWSLLSLIFVAFDYRGFVLFMLFFNGVLYAAHLFPALWSKERSTHYLTLPASIFEKTIAGIFLNCFYPFLMTLLAYCIGNGLIILIYHTFLHIYIPIQWDLFTSSTVFIENGAMQTMVNNHFIAIFTAYCFQQSILLVGSLYFEKFSIVKTGFAAILTFVFFGLVQIGLLKWVWDVKYLKNAFLGLLVLYNDGAIPEILFSLVTLATGILTLFLWVTSFYRIGEKQN